MSESVNPPKEERAFLDALDQLSGGAPLAAEREQEILRELADYKHPSVAAHFIRVLEASAPTGKALILRACWENGADFSDALSLFVNYVKRGSWEESVEAFSVIEHTLGINPMKNKAALEQLMPEHLADIPKERLPLFLHLFDLISNDFIDQNQ